VFNLDVIAAAQVELNARRWTVSTPTAQERMDDEDAERRMLCGYDFVDRLIETGGDPFVYGGSQHLLELNRLVLCGTSPQRRVEFARHLAASEQRFYDDPNCGADSFYAWMEEHRGLKPLPLAARVYRRIVGAPQLFIEGNQRTATLVTSFLLGRAGFAPLVRTAGTFQRFATLSERCKGIDRRRFSSKILGWWLDRKLQQFIARSLEDRFLTEARQAPNAR